MTFNVSFIHKNLALRWLYVTNPFYHAFIKEYTLKSSIHQVIEDLKESNTHVVGLSVYIFNHEKSKQLIQAIKKQLPHILILVGGPEVTYQVEQWLDYGAHKVIKGEGEFAFWQAIESDDIYGVATKDKPNTSVLQVDLHKLENYPNPYFLDIDKKDEQYRYLYVEASRGCPFSCTYCMASIEHGVRSFSLSYMQNILSQIEHSNVKSIKFLDRTFNSSPKRALQLIEALNNIKRPLSVQIEVEVSIWDDLLHDFFIKHGKKDRFRFEIGIQTFNQTTLKSIQRKQNNEKLKHVIASLTQAGYVVHADLISGLPYENKAQFARSFNELLKLYPSEIQLGILKGLHGTKLKEQAKHLNIVFDPQPPYSIVRSPWMSESDLLDMQYAALAVDKIYNKQLALSLIQHVANKDIDMLDYFVDVGCCISKLKHPYQVKDVVMCILHNTNVVTFDKALALLALDFGKKSKQKVKDLPFIEFDSDDVMKMQLDISERLSLPLSMWRSNSWLYVCDVHDEIGYQWIVYSMKKRYYYFKGAQFVYEQDHTISHP